MITQKFKGDTLELQMEAAGKPAFDSTTASLNQYFDGAYQASDFLLMLYDAGRMPFEDRVPRDSFVSFIKQAIPNFPVTGTFDAYLFILNAIFGSGSGVQFTVPAAGKLQILVNAAAGLDFTFIAQEFNGTDYDIFNMITDDGDSLEFKGISGINSQVALQALLAELIPAGIFTVVTLDFFAIFNFISDDGYTMVDYLGNQIIFFET